MLAAAMAGEGDLVATRMARGCRCFAAWIGDELAGYSWLSTQSEWVGELELTITPHAGEGYIWNCVTLPAHRRQGVLRALLARLKGQAQAENFRRLWIGSVAIPAEKAFGPAGFTPVLLFASELIVGYRWLHVRPAEEADPALVAAGHQVVGVPSGTFLRTSHPRRH
jgi:GNAT superfamily N-acetyltransferase